MGAAYEHVKIGDEAVKSITPNLLFENFNRDKTYKFVCLSGNNASLEKTIDQKNTIYLKINEKNQVEALWLPHGSSASLNVTLTLTEEERSSLAETINGSLSNSNPTDDLIIEFQLTQKIVQQTQFSPFEFIFSHINLNNLSLQNGLALSFGMIVALMGDFYGIPKRPISYGKEQKDQTKRFDDAFKSFSELPANDEEIKALVTLIKREGTLIEDYKSRNKTASQAYQKLNHHFNHDIDFGRATAKGGYTLTSRYINLLRNNYDHFPPNAHTAYQIGHDLALKTALEARNNFNILLSEHPSDYQNTTLLEPIFCQLNKAFALEAAACHYGTDSFFSGHLKSNRNHENSFSALLEHSHLGKKRQLVEGYIGGTKCQWRSVGDCDLLNEDSDAASTLKASSEFVSKGISEVYTAFTSGSIKQSEMLLFFPRVVEKPAKKHWYSLSASAPEADQPPPSKLFKSAMIG